MLRCVTVCGMLAVLVAGLAGCGEAKDPNRKVTSPVKGIVKVDGQPASGVRVELRDVKGFDTANPSVSSATTDAEGKFEITTYDLNDGAPPGEYTVLFTWQPIQIMNQGAQVPDKLKGRYATPEKSTVKVTVTEGSPVDMGTVELTTK